MAASKLAAYRRKKGLTQEQLSELSGVTTRTIQRIEKGDVVPHVQTLKMLADCLGIETDQLMDAPEGNATTDGSTKKTSLVPLVHLLALIGLFLPILNLILPFVFWLIKKDEGVEYNQQGKQVMNFQLSMTALFFPAIVLMVFFFPIGFPLTTLIYIFMVVMSIINLYRSVKLLPVSYPLSYPFFNVLEAK